MNSVTIFVNQNELNVVRRKLSFEFDKDFTSEEAIQFLIEREYNISKQISFHKKPNVRAEKSDIKKSIINGLTSTEAMKELGISRATFFRHKARAKKGQDEEVQAI
jgi:DNA invertase Pin-like site-specific DNA recombinase